MTEEGRSLRLGGPKRRALLAILLIHANEALSTDRLIEALWGERPPATASKTLQVHVSQLRRHLGADRVVTRAPGYMLRVDDDELDLGRFEALTVEARGALPAVASTKLREALALWRGSPLADFTFEPFAGTEIARLEELRMAAVEDRIEADLALGGGAELVPELEGLVVQHPLRERLRRQLMLGLYRSGRQADALETYGQARAVLTDELGLEPSEALKDLQRAILAHDPSLDSAPERQVEAETVEVASSSGPGAFVGREREMRELLRSLDEAGAGEGRLTLLTGEPGIGKSRLAEQLIRRARQLGVDVLVGRCWEAGGAPPYWPWVQALRTLVGSAEPAVLRSELGTGAGELAQLLPELRGVFPVLSTPPALESEGARFRLFEAVAVFFRNASARRPLVLFLDDLHAADEPSLLLLRYLAREIGSMHVLLLAALRDVAPIPSEPLTAMLAEATRESATRRLSLFGLNERDIAEYVELAAAEIASEELIAALHAETEGNPLFVTETVRLLALEGVRHDSTGGLIAVPQSLRDVIARRLAHLSEGSNRVLLLAAVLGREFDLLTLAYMAGVDEGELLETLDEPMASRIVSDVPSEPDRLRFTHVLIRDTLYDGLTAARRVLLHKLAIQALDARHGIDSGAHLAELAYHAVAGREFDKGIDYAERAGERAAALFAYEEAARLYGLALEAARSEDDPVRCRLLLRMGDVQARAGNRPLSKETYLRAAQIARSAALPEQLARAALGYGGRFVWSRAWGDQHLVPLLEEALDALPNEDSDLRVRLLARLSGGPLRDTLRAGPRVAMSQTAVDMARRLGDQATLAYALEGRYDSYWGPDSLDERVAITDELLQLAEETGDREYEARDRRFYVLLEAGDLQAARDVQGAKARLAGELREPAHLWDVRISTANLDLFMGRFEDAERTIEEALELGRLPASANAHAGFELQLYGLRREQGRLDEVADAVASAVERYPSYPVWRYVVADAFAALDRREAARDALDALAADGFAMQVEMQWLFSLTLLPEVCRYLADVERSAMLYELLLPYASLNAVTPPELCRGSVSRGLGILAETMSRWDDAVQHFERAIEANERMGAHPWLAHTRHDYGRMLLSRSGSDEREHAGTLLRQALATYRELGMQGYAAEATALVVEFGIAP